MVLALLMFSDMTSRIHSELVMIDNDGKKKYLYSSHTWGSLNGADPCLLSGKIRE